MNEQVIPQKVLALQDIARRFYEKHEVSVYEQVVQAELELASSSDIHRIIDVNSHFVSICRSVRCKCDINT
jgi:galactose-1-phosphate uridylyltransferase